MILCLVVFSIVIVMSNLHRQVSPVCAYPAATTGALHGRGLRLCLCLIGDRYDITASQANQGRRTWAPRAQPAAGKALDAPQSLSKALGGQCWRLRRLTRLRSSCRAEASILCRCQTINTSWTQVRGWTNSIYSTPLPVPPPMHAAF